MREIFTDLYNKVVGFFQQQQQTEDASKSVACNRLKLVLMQDRTNLTPLVLERMRGEMIELLSKYVEMDKEALELNFEHEGDQMALMLSIPVLRAKEEDEIKAMLEAEDAKKAEEEAKKAELEESEEKEASEENDSEEETEEAAEEEVCGCGCESEEACTCGDECDCDETRDCGCQEETAETEETEEEESEPVSKKKSTKKK